MPCRELAGIVVLAAGIITAQERPAGVVVESVISDYAAHGAGLREGDIVLAWSRGNARGDIQSPFDLMYIEAEQAPRGAVTIVGRRGGQEHHWSIKSDEWGLQARPVLSDTLLRLYEEGRSLEGTGKSSEAAGRWRAAAAQTQNQDASWLLLRAAEALAKTRLWKECDQTYQAALAQAAIDGFGIRVLLLRSWADTFKQRSDWIHAEEYYGQALTESGELDADLTAAAVLSDLGVIAESRGDLVRAEEHHTQALAIRENNAPASLTVASSLNALGRVACQRGHLQKWQDYTNRALALQERLAPGSLAAATSLSDLGHLAWMRGDLGKADEYHRSALAIRERLAPGSLKVASSLNGLGLVAWNRGDLDKAEEYHLATLRILEKLAPDSLQVARTLNNLGNVLLDHGDLAKAEEHYRASLTIRQKLAPGSLDVASSLNNLGLVAWNRGDLAKSDEYHQAALMIRQKLAPGSLDVAMSLNNLGLLARDRGDLSKAEECYRRALTIREKLAPGSLDVAASLGNLGLLARDRGDLKNAENYHRAATAIFEKLAPGSVHHAKSLATIGKIAQRRGDWNKAEEYHRAALRIFEEVAPGSLDVADGLINLGEVALDRDRLDEAERQYRAAIAIREKLAPGSLENASALAGLAEIMKRSNRLAAAAQLFAQSLDALEHQTSELGGSESLRARYRAEHAGYYRGFIDVLLAQKRPEAAFQVLERSRARSLLEMLGERDLVFAADLPLEIRVARRRNAAAFDRTQSDIAALTPHKDSARIEQLQKRLQELAREREEITERVRRASPRLATLQYPQPLDLETTRRNLDPGTALLSYVVAETQTALFVVLPAGTEPGLSLFTVPVSLKVLRRHITELRALIEQPEGTNSVRVAARLHELYRLLIKPAESVISGNERLLIIPDGPLQVLPFAALRRDSGEYLVEWKPLHTAISATVYAELKGRRNGASKPIALAAFGDPLYPSDGVHPVRIADADLRLAAERGLAFSRLLFSGPEVESITGLFARGSYKYLREEATEEHAKALGKDVRYVHFATHGLLDERLSLNSALVLTIPRKLEDGRENGLLQAWEIFEQLRIDADLVTLSGCKTALGQELAGEGMVSLARAFQYAGAHSVLASLWSVDDRKTSLLMEHFYKELRNGKSKAEALRAAQIRFLRSPDTRRVLYWAAFVLNGDWR